MAGFIIAIVFMLAAMIFAVIRGTSRSIFRIIGIAVSAVGALGVTLWVKSIASSQASVLELLNTLGVETADIAELLSQIGEYSPTLAELLAGTTVSFLAPFLFMVLFIALAIVTWALYFVLSLILFPVFHKIEKKRGSKVKALIVGFVQGALVLFLVISPISYYSTVVDDVIPVLEENGVVAELAETANMTEEGLKDVLNIGDDSLLSIVKLNSKLGGKAFSNALATYSYQDDTGEKVSVNLAEEVSPVLKLVTNFMKLAGTPMENFGHEQAVAIENVGASFSESPLMTSVSKQFVHGLTSAWIDGKPYATVSKPELGEPTDEIFNNIIKIFNKSSESTENLGTDVKDISKIVAILVESEIMKDMNAPEQLIDKLATSQTINDVTAILRNNERLRPLISDITTLSIYVLADTIGVPKDKETVYLNMLNDISAKLNEIKELDTAEKLEVLEPFIKNELAMIGAEVSDEYVSSITKALIMDFGDIDGVTPEFIAEFFLVYEQSRGELNDTEEIIAGSFYGFVRLESNDSDFTFPKYLTQALREISGAGIVGKLDAEIIKITATDASDDEKREAIKEAVNELMAPIFNGIVEASENKEKAEDIIKSYADSVQNLSEKSASENIESSDNLASFAKQESASINCMTLTDIKDKFQTTAELTDEAEAEKHSQVISQVLGCASSLISATKKDDTTTPPEGGDTETPDTGKNDTLDILKTATESLGAILDTLSETQVFGKDDTAELMGAILTSDTVSNVIPLTKEDAGNIVDKVKNDENVSYGSLMTGVSGMAELIFAMTDGACTLDNVKNLISGLDENNIDAIMVIVTEQRFESLGIKGDKVTPTYNIMSALLHRLARIPDDKVDAEANAVKKLIDVALEAKVGGTGLFGEQGRIGDAKVFIDEILASEAVCNTIEGTEADPFGVAEKVSDEDKALFKSACESYIGTEDEETVRVLASILGIDID